MQSFIYDAHSFLRWVIVVVAAVTVLKLLMVWLGGKEYGKGDTILTKSFTGLLDLQLLLGLILIISLSVAESQFTRERMEHGVTNIIAIGLVHLSAKWKRSPGPVRARNTVFMILLAMVLIVAAVMRLPQGW